MRKVVLILFCLLIASTVWSEDAVQALTVPARCDVQFFGTSTLHDFSGKVSSMPFDIILAAESATQDIPTTVEVDIPVKAMDTGNQSRDEKMRKMFAGEQYPLIRGLFKTTEPYKIRQAMLDSEKGNGTVTFTLGIRDIEHQIAATTSNLQETEDRVSFHLTFAVSLSQYGLKAPSVLGLIRVGDQVNVGATVTLEVGSADLLANITELGKEK